MGMPPRPDAGHPLQPHPLTECDAPIPSAEQVLRELSPRRPRSRPPSVTTSPTRRKSTVAGTAGRRAQGDSGTPTRLFAEAHGHAEQPPQRRQTGGLEPNASRWPAQDRDPRVSSLISPQSTSPEVFAHRPPVAHDVNDGSGIPQDPLRAALATQLRGQRRENEFENGDPSATFGEWHAGDRYVRAFATPRSRIFASESPAESPSTSADFRASKADTQTNGEDERGAVARSGRLSGATLDPADLQVLENEEDRRASNGYFMVKTRRVVSSTTASSTMGSLRQRARLDASSQDLASLSTPTSSRDDYIIVRRSIADFAWLHSALRNRYEAVIVPPLPDMAIVGRLQHGYMYEHQRKKGLEKFLQRVASHAVLSTVDETIAFLGLLGEETWASVRKDVSRHQSVIASALFGRRAADEADPDLWHWLSRWGSYKMWQAGRRLNRSLADFLERDLPESSRRRQSGADIDLLRLKTYVQELDKMLAAVRQAARRASTSQSDHVRADELLNTALVTLGGREGGNYGRLLQNAMIVHGNPKASRPPLDPPAADHAASASAKSTSPSGQHDVGESPSKTASFRATASLRRNGSAASVATVRDYSQFRESDFQSTSEPSTPKDALHPVQRTTTGSLVASTWLNGDASADQRLDDVLRDYEQRAAGARRIMGARLDEQEAYEHALEVYTRRRDRIEARTGSIWESNDGRPSAEPVRGQGIEEMYYSFVKAATALADARKQYQEVAIATTEELKRLRREMHDDTASALAAVASENARYHRVRAAAWAQLAEQCLVYTAKPRRGARAQPGSRMRRSMSATTIPAGPERAQPSTTQAQPG